MSAIRAKYRELDDDPNTTWQDIDLAETRVRIEAAIDLAAETWPSCRALIEWLIRKPPDGGSGPTRSQWDADALADLTDEFFRSANGSRLDDRDRRDLLESLLWFATDYSTGDPLRWSEVKGELLHRPLPDEPFSRDGGRLDHR